MAPEMSKKRKGRKAEEYDPFASDMWSLGITIYQTVTGRLPFEAESAADYLLATQNPEISVPDLPEWVPKFWRDAVKKLLDRDPAKRPTA